MFDLGFVLSMYACDWLYGETVGSIFSSQLQHSGFDFQLGLLSLCRVVGSLCMFFF